LANSDVIARVRQWTRLLPVLGAAILAASCSDRSSVGLIAPGHARLALAPRFAIAPGAPTVLLSRVEGSLTRGDRDTTFAKANFLEGSASLTFDVQLNGDGEDFILDLVGFDMNGIEAYRAHKIYHIRPGLNDDLDQPDLEYSAPDSKAVSLHLSAGTSTLDPGATTRISITGTGTNEAPITPIRVGWVSRNPAVATVDDSGLVTAARLKAATYIVARTPANLADSILITTRGAVAQIVATPPSITMFRGTTANVTAAMRDSVGTVITDRVPTFATSDDKIATVSAAGVVAGVAVGTANITATVEGVTATVPVSVVPGLTITPGTAEKLPKGTQQFTTSGGSGPFTWSVNGVNGGNATFGTITSAGFYTAPDVVPTPSSFDVCATQEAPAAKGCATVTINPIPTSGADVIVFNDINSFDQQAAADPNNVQLFKNIVNYTGPGPRATQTAVLRTCGHGTNTCATDATFASTVQSVGYSMSTNSDPTIPIPIPSNVKVLILSLPRVSFSYEEINAMKAFSAEGGRILYIGEYDTFLGVDGLATENDFFIKMGAVMRNVGNQIDCGYNVVPPANLRPHQVTTAMTGLTMGCASEVILGPNDYPIYVSLDTKHVLAAVAKVDVTPLPPTPTANRSPASARLNRSPAPASATLDPVGRDLVKKKPTP